MGIKCWAQRQSLGPNVLTVPPSLQVNTRALQPPEQSHGREALPFFTLQSPLHVAHVPVSTLGLTCGRVVLVCTAPTPLPKLRIHRGGQSYGHGFCPYTDCSKSFADLLVYGRHRSVMWNCGPKAPRECCGKVSKVSSSRTCETTSSPTPGSAPSSPLSARRASSALHPSPATSPSM